jgi:hypothetical protein
MLEDGGSAAKGVRMGFDLGILVWAAGIIGVLMLVTRWVFSPSRPRTGRPEGGPHANLGLLTPVLSHAGRSDALAAKNLLSQQGIRCSVSRLERDSYDVLVFGVDADRARQLLSDDTRS